MGPRVSVLRTSRSRVPGNRSMVIMGCLLPIYLTPSKTLLGNTRSEEHFPAIIDGKSITHVPSTVKGKCAFAYTGWSLQEKWQGGVHRPHSQRRSCGRPAS